MSALLLLIRILWVTSMRSCDLVDARKFITMDGKVMDFKISTFVKSLMNVYSGADYLLVREEKTDEHVLYESAYIASPLFVEEMLESELESVLSEHKMSLLIHNPSRRIYDPVNISVEKYFGKDILNPEHIRMVLRINGVPVIARETMKAREVKDEVALFEEILEESSSRSKQALTLTYFERWVLSADGDSWHEDGLFGPYNLVERTRIGKLAHSPSEFYNLLYTKDEFYRWLVRDRRFDAHILCGYEKSVDPTNMIMLRFKTL